jgi:hypothetical protein
MLGLSDTERRLCMRDDGTIDDDFLFYLRTGKTLKQEVHGSNVVVATAVLIDIFVIVGLVVWALVKVF